jgi:DNA-binding GntR family transcriptional regulator
MMGGMMTDERRRGLSLPRQAKRDKPAAMIEGLETASAVASATQVVAVVQITGADRVYEAIYHAVLERRLSPGERLREQELAEQFNVSRTLVRQALQRLAQEQVIELLHNRGARVPIPSLEDAGSVFDARRVVECEVAKQLAGRLSAEQLQTLQDLADGETEADRIGEHALAIRLSGEFHQAMADMHGNPVMARWLNGLLPTTSLLMSRFKQQGGQVCVAHRHVDLISALQKSPAAAGAEMRKHLNELEQSLTAPATPRRQLRDVFQAYRDSPE